MNIQQAIKKAMELNKCITRNNPYWLNFAKLKPGHLEDNYWLILCSIIDQKEYRGWQPQASDILASDWVICD